MIESMTSTEHVISTVPLVVRRRVKFGDCDPAGLVYTPVFSEYAISCAALFYESLLGAPLRTIKNEHGFETPSRALSFDFRGSLRPDDEFDMTVLVADIRNSTYTLQITGTSPDGAELFIAQLTPICVARGELRAIAIPQALRARLEEYRKLTG